MTVDTTATNGHQEGRVVPPLPVFTFSTGITVDIRRVSPYTMLKVRQQLEKKFPAPRPPMNEVPNPADDGKTITYEPNYADPDYERAVTEHTLLINTKSTDVMVDLGTACEPDEVALNELTEIIARSGLDLMEDEVSIKVAYIKYIAVGGNDDITGLIQAIQGASQPTQEVVQAHLAAFPGDVSGA